jgi:hypothetical protein
MWQMAELMVMIPVFTNAGSFIAKTNSDSSKPAVRYFYF